MKKTLLFFTLLLFLSTGFSQELMRSPVGEKIQTLKARGTDFQAIELFDRLPVSKDRTDELSRQVTNPVLLSPRSADMLQLLRAKPATVSMTLLDPEKQEITLDLYQVSVTSADFKVVTASGGVVDTEFPMVHYRGIIRGEHHSLVAVSVFEEEVMGLISGAEGNLVLGKLKGSNKTNEHILYRERDLADDFEFACDTPDDGVVYTREQLTPYAGRSTGDCTNIYVEVDYDIYQSKSSSVQNTANYVTGLFNQVAVLYNDLDGSAGGSNNGIEIGVSEIKIWDVNQSPYSGSNSSSNLSAFQSANGQFNGDLGIILNYAISGGVAAGFNGICNGDPDASMCAAGIDATYENVPTFSWSVFVSAHELGHLFGSRHTHACVWNGNGTAIDGCYRTEGRCRKASIPAGGGTIMSYCHLESVGINFTESFGPQPGTVIYNTIANAACLGASCNTTNVVSVSNDPCSNGIQDGDEEGVDCGGSNCAPCNTGGGACDPATPVNTTGITKREATMNWSGTAGGTAYVLDIRQVGGTTWQDFSTSGTSISLQGFRNGLSYEWRVRAICGSTEADPSSICTFIAGGASTQSCGGTLPAGLIEEEISFYPNPASDRLQVNISLPDAEKVQLSIIDMMGRRVQGADLENGIFNQSIDVSGLSAGVYLLRVEAGDRNITRKIVIN